MSKKKMFCHILKMSESDRSWITVLSEFTNQLQLVIYGCWTISFAMVANLTKLDTLKDVLGQFNKIALNPTGTLILNMEADIFVDDSNGKLTAYVEKDAIIRMGGSLMGSVFSDNFEMTLIYNNNEYELTAKDTSEMKEYYKFSSVFLNTSNRQNRVLSMTFEDTYDRIESKGFAMWSISKDGEYISTKSSPICKTKGLSIEQHVEFMASSTSEETKVSTFVQFQGTLVRIMSPLNLSGYIGARAHIRNTSVHVVHADTVGVDDHTDTVVVDDSGVHTDTVVVDDSGVHTDTVVVDDSGVHTDTVVDDAVL
jgi:hypothetical protein